ncbi:MAG: hypothetical protein AMXMBFR64_25260 [Myxococcales bacterium]
MRSSLLWVALSWMALGGCKTGGDPTPPSGAPGPAGGATAPVQAAPGEPAKDLGAQGATATQDPAGPGKPTAAPDPAAEALAPPAGSPAPGAPEGAEPTAPTAPCKERNVLQEIRINQVLRIATEEDNEPMCFKDDDDQWTGFEYALMVGLAKQLDAKLEIVITEFDDFPAALCEGRADLAVGGVFPTDDWPGVAYSKPYLETGLALFVAKDRVRDFPNTAALAGRTIGITKGDSYPRDFIEGLKLSPAPIIREYTWSEEVEDNYFTKLLDREIEAFVYDYPFGIVEARKEPYRGKVLIAAHNLKEGRYAVALPASDTPLLSEVDRAVEKFRGSADEPNPAYAALLREYFSQGTETVQALNTVPCPAARTYTVKSGDTLYRISSRTTPPMSWRTLYEANKARIPNPNIIEVGQVLCVP